MQFAIPHAPRPVKLSQVPGAIRRLLLVFVLGLAGCAGLGVLASFAGRWFSSERAFLSRATEVEGTVLRVSLPPKDRREGQSASFTAVYAFADLQRSATGIVTRAEFAEGIGPGAKVSLLVDPADPEHPRDAGYARSRGGILWWVPAAVGLGLLIALLAFLFELRRTLRSELEPLRLGALVWLTPDQPLPETRTQISFDASYFRDDVKHEVRARGRPGRSPVRNGDKLLAAVVPAKPNWARLVDEDLARELGWVR